MLCQPEGHLVFGPQPTRPFAHILDTQHAQVHMPVVGRARQKQSMSADCSIAGLGYRPGRGFFKRVGTRRTCRIVLASTGSRPRRRLHCDGGQVGWQAWGIVVRGGAGSWGLFGKRVGAAVRERAAGVPEMTDSLLPELVTSDCPARSFAGPLRRVGRDRPTPASNDSPLHLPLHPCAIRRSTLAYALRRSLECTRQTERNTME